MSDDGPKTDPNGQIRRNYSTEPQSNIKAEQETLRIFLVSCLVSCYTTFSFYFCSLQCYKFPFFISLKISNKTRFGKGGILARSTYYTVIQENSRYHLGNLPLPTTEGRKFTMQQFEGSYCIAQFIHRKLSFTKSLSNSNYHQLGCSLFFTDVAILTVSSRVSNYKLNF